MKKSYTNPAPIKAGEWHGISGRKGVFIVVSMDAKRARLRSPSLREITVPLSMLINRNGSPQMEDFFRQIATHASRP